MNDGYDYFQVSWSETLYGPGRDAYTTVRHDNLAHAAAEFLAAIRTPDRRVALVGRNGRSSITLASADIGYGMVWP